MMTHLTEQTESEAALPTPESLEAAARTAFAEHVWLYDQQDQIIVQGEPHQMRLVYFSRRASRQSGCASFIQCRVDERCWQMWISTLKLSEALRRQGLGRDMVEASEATARAIGVLSIKVCPLPEVVGFWKSLGYTWDARISCILHKNLR